VTETNQDFLKSLIKRNRYLSLATTDGSNPWVAPLEYISDDDLNLYYFSPESAAHSLHIGEHQTVAIAVFDAAQPEYEPAQVMRIAGAQALAQAERLSAPFPDLVIMQIDAWQLPMPPYAAYKITPTRWYLPVLKNGINERLEVKVS
jgi:uncharacterized protein YhbP (UPF0306 family)